MYRNFRFSAASTLELPHDIMKFKLIVRYNFTCKINITKYFAEARTELETFKKKYSADTFYAMEAITRCPISQV
jgi:hypothetical protein